MNFDGHVRKWLAVIGAIVTIFASALAGGIVVKAVDETDDNQELLCNVATLQARSPTGRFVTETDRAHIRRLRSTRKFLAGAAGTGCNAGVGRRATHIKHILIRQ